MSDAEGGRIVLLDACTLIPIRLTTVLLWLAEAGLFEVLWSDQILDEVERNLPKVGVGREQAARRVTMMRDAFGAASLVDDFDDLVPQMTCDPKDRHVLAAAVRGAATTLLTFNQKDFPPASTEQHGIEVLHPDSFLVRLLSEHAEEVVAVLDRNVADRRRPPQTTRDFLVGLAATVPLFAYQFHGETETDGRE